MKALLTLYVLLAFVMASVAQGPSLTKDETVNYLNRKAKEVIDHYRSVPTDDKKSTITYYYSANEVSMNGDKLKISQARKSHRDNVIKEGYYPCSYHMQKHENIFNPAHILSIEKDPNVVSGEPIGVIKITLKYNTGQWNFSLFSPAMKSNDPNSSGYGLCYSFGEYLPSRLSSTKNVMYLSYLQSDDTNFTKIKKALEYLRDLCKAEDDPFGN